MYAPALRIWSLANPLMFLLLLPVLAAFMSGATAAAAVVAAAGATAAATTAGQNSRLPLSSSVQMHPLHGAPPASALLNSTTLNSTFNPPTRPHTIDGSAVNHYEFMWPTSRHTTAAPATVTVGDSNAKPLRGSRRRRHASQLPPRNRRHAMRHAVGERWHSRTAVTPIPQQQQQQPQEHTSPNGSTIAADQNWWRSSMAASELHRPMSNTATDSLAKAANPEAAGVQQAQQAHVTRHHHHQNYHLHKTLQAAPQPQQQQPQEQRAAPQPQPPLSQWHPFSAIAMRQPLPLSMPSTTSAPPAALIAHQPAKLATTLSSVLPAFSANFGRRSHHNANNNNNNHHNQFHQHHAVARRRYCSARDVATLAFEAPTVFEGKVKSMSADRRHNFSVTFEVVATHKEQPQLVLPPLVRLQFEQRNTSGECDIYREQLRPRGFVRELESGRVYLLFVEQQRGDIGNFSILGRPVRRTAKSLNETLAGVKATYGKYRHGGGGIDSF